MPKDKRPSPDAGTVPPVEGTFVVRDPYTITLSGVIEMRLKKPHLEMQIKIDPPAESSNEPFAAKIQVPLSLFSDKESLSEVMSGSVACFKQALRDALTAETALHFVDAANYALADYNLSPDEKQEIIASHLSKTAERIKKTLGIPTRGRRSKWSAVDLSLAIKGVIQTNKDRRWSYELVARHLKTTYGAKAPKTGEALRKLVEDFGLNWMTLKSGE
jgi:hypothetical protein